MSIAVNYTAADRNVSKTFYDSVTRLEGWVERADWKGYDPFDGLSSPFARFLTFNRPLLKQIWLHVVRRFPVNLRPLLRVKPGMSSKAMGFFAQGYLRLYLTHGRTEHLDKMKFCLQWLMDNPSPGFRGACWGNHFGGQTRGGYIAKGMPTIVWTGLIGHAFLDAYDTLGDARYVEIAKSACDFILDELGWMEMDDGICFQYYPQANCVVHNSNMIGASLLARVSALSSESRYRDFAAKAVRFTVSHQTAEGAWYYGVGKKWHWIDSFHTGYVLEALHAFCKYCESTEYEPALRKGYRYFVETFFKPCGTPRYYSHKTRPLDIQCASHGIQALVSLRAMHSGSLELAQRVATWTITNMQDPTGYFYYRKYPLVTNKTPTLHWGQATMFAALALLDQCLSQQAGRPDGRLAAQSV